MSAEHDGKALMKYLLCASVVSFVTGGYISFLPCKLYGNFNSALKLLQTLFLIYHSHSLFTPCWYRN